MKPNHHICSRILVLKAVSYNLIVVLYLSIMACGGPTIYGTSPQTRPQDPTDQKEVSNPLMSLQSPPPSITRGQWPNEQTISEMGPFEVRRFGYEKGLRHGPQFSTATVYYPVQAKPPFASIVLVPGYLHGESSISSWGPFLASHGIVVMTIGTNDRTDDPFKRRDALLDALVSLRGEHSRSQSPLFKQLQLHRMAVGGWSMGGGGAQLAATKDPSLRAVMALCPWLPNAVFIHAVPTLIFAGTLDTIATVWRHARPHYEGIPKQTPKLLYEVTLGTHWVGNDPENAGGYIGRVGLSWLKVHLEGDIRYLPLLLKRPSNANEYRENLNQTVPINGY